MKFCCESCLFLLCFPLPDLSHPLALLLPSFLPFFFPSFFLHLSLFLSLLLAFSFLPVLPSFSSLCPPFPCPVPRPIPLCCAVCAVCAIFFVCCQVVWTGLTRKSPENAWVAKVPTWPLTFVFLGQVGAVAGGVYWVVKNGESKHTINTVVLPL